MHPQDPMDCCPTGRRIAWGEPEKEPLMHGSQCKGPAAWIRTVLLLPFNFNLDNLTLHTLQKQSKIKERKRIQVFSTKAKWDELLSTHPCLWTHGVNASSLDSILGSQLESCAGRCYVTCFYKKCFSPLALKVSRTAIQIQGMPYCTVRGPCKGRVWLRNQMRKDFQF